MAEHTNIEHSRNTVHNSTLDAQGNITVGDQYITNLYSSADYEQLMKREAEWQEMLDFYQAKGDDQQALAKSQALNEHRKTIAQFKSDVLQLASTFASIPINTERLKQAKALFEQGKFKAADTLLTYQDIKDDQNQLLAARQRNEAEKKSIDTALATNANEFLIKAQTTALDYDNSKRFEDTCRYFKASIQSQENEENLFTYADFLQDHNQNKKSEAHYERLLNQFREKLSPAQLALIIHNLGILYWDRNEHGQAKMNYQEALEVRRKLAQANPETYLPEVAMTLNNLGLLLADTNEYAEAKSNYREAIKIRRKLVQSDPEAYLPYLARTLNNLGILQKNLKEYTEAEKSYLEAIKVRSKLTRLNSIHLCDKAMTHNNLGVLYWNRKEYSKANLRYQEALKICQKLAQFNPHTYSLDVAMVLNNLGLLQTDNNQYVQAERSYQEALGLYRKLAEANPPVYLPKVAMTLINWAILNQKLGKWVSLDQVKEGLEILVPLVDRMPFAQEIVKEALGILNAWQIEPTDFFQEHNLPLNLLQYQS